MSVTVKSTNGQFHDSDRTRYTSNRRTSPAEMRMLPRRDPVTPWIPRAHSSWVWVSRPRSISDVPRGSVRLACGGAATVVIGAKTKFRPFGA